MPGSFDVDPSGAATYSIPIEVPPGINGIQPELSLNYSSNSGNGQLGLGWNLSAISGITRCGSSNLTDGFKRAVGFNSSDNYCFNGQRLIEFENGIFRPEIGGSGIEVVRFGSEENPDYFSIADVGGITKYYGSDGNGGGNDSRFYQEGSSNIFQYNIKKLEDVYGNKVEYSYHENGYEPRIA